MSVNVKNVGKTMRYKCAKFQFAILTNKIMYDERKRTNLFKLYQELG